MQAIELRNVDMSYPQSNGGRISVLEDFSLTVPEGTIFCLLGPNGSGKTTTINLITGLLTPVDGDISVLGSDPKKDPKRIRKLLSLVPQETALYNDLTGRENLVFHARYYGVDKDKQSERVDEVLELVGLTDRQDDRVESYSGGMQRRLALARALVTSPELILLDEPTLGVDVQSRHAIWDRCRELAAAGKTIFLTTNYMEEADALADTITILDHGNVVVSGSPDELEQAVDANTLVIEFEHAADAETVYTEVVGASEATLDGTRVLVPISEKQRVFELLQEVRPHSDSVAGFELRQPTLNDVFLHFTGRQLRD